MNNEFTGKTVEDAIKEGLKTLGLTEENAIITVLEEPQKGFLGIVTKHAKVSIVKKKTDIERAVEFLDGLFNALGMTVATELTTNSENKPVINLITTDSSQIIGYRGEVLDSIQNLASAVYNSGSENYTRLVVDCEGYRDKREETLKNLAIKLAGKAVKTGRKVVLEPMTPFERRIIHSTLVDFEGVQTASEGKEPNRYIAIIPDGYDPQRRDRFNRSNNRRGGGKNFDKRGGHGNGGRNNRARQGGRNNNTNTRQKPAFGGAVFLGNSQRTQVKVEEDD